MRSDVEFVIHVLRSGPASTNDILRRSITERGVGCTVHSRISDARRILEATGETITCHAAGRTTAGRTEYHYQIVSARPGQLTFGDAA